MELFFRLLDELRQEVIGEIVKPPEDKQTEFHFGRIHGQLYIMGMLEERMKLALEEQADQQQKFEESF